MTYDGKAAAERAAHTITPGPGQEYLYERLRGLPDSAFQGENAQEELGALLEGDFPPFVSGRHVTMRPEVG